LELREKIILMQRYDELLHKMENHAIARLNQILLNSYQRLERTMQVRWEEMQRDRPFISSYRQLYVAEQLGVFLQVINPREKFLYESLFNELLIEASNYGIDISTDFIGTAFSNVPVEAITFSVQESYNRLLRHGDNFATQASIVIGEGLAQGWGVNKVTALLREQLGIIKSRAEAIARTESIKAYSNASQQKYKDAGINEVIWVTVREGVCKFCAWRSGKAFKLGSVIHPGHVSCRCALYPVVGDKDNDFWATYLSEDIDDPGMMPFEKNAGFAIAPNPTWIPKLKKNG